MKRFHELTESQQDQAVTFATDELKDCVERGLVSFDKPVNNTTLKDYAICAAEDAWYSEPGDKVIDDIASQE